MVNILTAHKTDFFIVSFALFYVYTVFAASFNLPLISRQEFLLFDLLPSFVSQMVDIIVCQARTQHRVLAFLCVVQSSRNRQLNLQSYSYNQRAYIKLTYGLTYALGRPLFPLVESTKA